MPKTAAEKRAEARRETRVRSAHQTTQTTTPTAATSRRIPQGRPGARGGTRGSRSFIEQYPYLTGIIVLVLLGLVVLAVHQARLGPWAPPSPPAAAHCDLTTHVCTKAPKQTINVKDTYTATITTARGNIVIELEPGSAPQNVNNFVFLAQQRFYDGLSVSRVERVGQTSSVTHAPSNLALAQMGVGGKNGGPGFAMPNEAPAGTYAEGTVAMANGSQFFICTGDDASAISGTRFPIVGKVVSGLDVAQALQAGDRIQHVTISVSAAPASTPTPAASATASPSPAPSASATGTP